MPDSILTVAGTGPVLEPEPTAADPAAACEASLLRAAGHDWRAALAWLQHSPATREQWSDAARVAAIYRANTAATIRGIDQWKERHGIPAETVMELLLCMQACGTADLDVTEKPCPG